MNTNAHNRKSLSRNVIGTFLIIVTIGFLVYQITSNPQDLSELFSKSDKSTVLFIIFLQLVSFAINAIISNALLTTTGEKVNFKNNLRISIMNEFGNRLMPIAGGSVTSYLGYSKLGLRTTSIVFMETALSSLTVTQYLLFFLGSLLYIPHSFMKAIPNIAFIGIIITLLCILSALLIVIKNRNKEFVKKGIIRFVRFISYILPIDIDEHDIDEKIMLGLHKVKVNFSLFFSQKINALTILVLSSLYLAVDITMLTLSFYAFGYPISFALVTFAMLVSLLLSILTLFPGNPGVTETSYVLIFNALGIPSKISILAVILFRLASYWVWLPLSTYFLVRNNSKKLPNSTQN